MVIKEIITKNEIIRIWPDGRVEELPNNAYILFHLGVGVWREITMSKEEYKQRFGCSHR